MDTDNILLQVQIRYLFIYRYEVFHSLIGIRDFGIGIRLEFYPQGPLIIIISKPCKNLSLTKTLSLLRDRLTCDKT